MTASRPRVCIVTPGQIGSNPRVVKEAQALAAAGCDVHVIASKVADFVEPRDQAILAAAPFKVTRVPFDTRVARAAGRIRQAAARRGFAVSGARSLAPAAAAPIWGKLREAALRTPADLYIGHYVAALEIVRAAATRHAARYAFDAEDFHSGDFPEGPAYDGERAIIQAIEAAFLPGAAYRTAASPGIADAYAKAYGLPAPHVIQNVFPLSEAPASATDAGAVTPGPTLYWFSQTIGPDRGLECAVTAIALARSRPHLHLRGTCSAGYRSHLASLAARHGCAEHLHFHDPAPPSEMARLAAKYDAGLAGETGATPNRRIALTNKQYTYLLAGIPAVMSDVEAHVRFAAEAPDAVALYEADNPASLAATLDRLFESPAILARARRTAFAIAQERLNWNVESSRLIALAAAALGRALPGGVDPVTIPARATAGA